MASTSLFLLPGTIDTVSGVGQGLQPGFGYILRAALATAKGSLLDAFQGGRDFFQGLLFILEQAERELLLEVVGAQVGHVYRRVRQATAGFPAGLAQCLAGQMRHVSFETIPQIYQLLPEILNNGSVHRVPQVIFQVSPPLSEPSTISQRRKGVKDRGGDIAGTGRQYKGKVARR
jgi:hypothetical protein